MHIAHVARKRGHVVSGVGEGEYVLANEVGNLHAADQLLEALGGDYGELFDDVPIQVLVLRFFFRAT